MTDLPSNFDAFNLIASRNSHNQRQAFPNVHYPQEIQTRLKLSERTALSPSAASRTSSGSGTSSSRRAKNASYHRITRLVSTMVHIVMLNNSPEQDSPFEWPRFAAEISAKPSPELYAFTHRILTSHKWALPVIMVALKFLVRFKRHHRETERLKAQILTMQAFGGLEIEHANMPSIGRSVFQPSQQVILLPESKFSDFGLLLASLMTANKFLDDERFSNKWWSKVSEFSLEDLGDLEMSFLVGLEFDLDVKDNEYKEWLSAMQYFTRCLDQVEERNNQSKQENLLNASKIQQCSSTFSASSVLNSPAPSISSISSASTCFSVSSSTNALPSWVVFPDQPSSNLQCNNNSFPNTFSNILQPEKDGNASFNFHQISFPSNDPFNW
ncbi:hypothetical protein HK096_005779 [Nowakowskiella sp. JEL0078]|nr:hypothetical protein HK096_005779 [Nowakowskiella sp. JEL0078]